jgi:hypothetical protein
MWNDAAVILRALGSGVITARREPRRPERRPSPLALELGDHRLRVDAAPAGVCDSVKQFGFAIRQPQLDSAVRAASIHALSTGTTGMTVVSSKKGA